MKGLLPALNTPLNERRPDRRIRAMNSHVFRRKRLQSITQWELFSRPKRRDARKKKKKALEKQILNEILSEVTISYSFFFFF